MQSVLGQVRDPGQDIGQPGERIDVVQSAGGDQAGWRDNVFVERLWRSVKYEEVYLNAYDSVSDARDSLAGYLDFYNRRRPHSALGSKTPDEAYFVATAMAMAA